MRLLRLFAKHQAGAALATLVDFLTMIAWVELASGSPVTGKALGASAGAVTSFLLGRTWIFRATHRPAPAQALRYGVVSAASLGWNTLGEWVLVRLLGVPYVAAALVVAIVVGVAWNFPLHRYFVFAGPPRREPRREVA